MNADFIKALEELEKERGILKETLLSAIEEALIKAYKRSYASAQNVRVDVDHESGDIRVFALKSVVETVEDDQNEVSLEFAQSVNRAYEIGDMLEIESMPASFGRIAAQTAKQVVVQRIREAERGMIFEEYSDKENEAVSALVERVEGQNIFVQLGRTEGVITANEQIPNERYQVNSRIKVYVLEVRNSTKGPQILVSRTHPGLVKRLFELEVPEIKNGIVQIKSIAREAGSRTKMAVYSVDEAVEAISACVGQRGGRVEKVTDELNGEKIDIVQWDPEPAQFIANALSPAHVIMVQINETARGARVIVPDNQLSLAIGREGQNARLAARLTGWKIDIKSQSQVQDLLNLDMDLEE